MFKSYKLLAVAARVIHAAAVGGGGGSSCGSCSASTWALTPSSALATTTATTQITVKLLKKSLTLKCYLYVQQHYGPRAEVSRCELQIY